MISALGGLFRDDTAKYMEYLDKCNSILADEIEFLRNQNQTLLVMLDSKISKSKINIEMADQEFEPIGKGYIPLRKRIADAEAKSREEYLKELDTQEELEKQNAG